MGPYSEQIQLERAERVKSLLARDDLTDWARNFWEGVVRNLAHNAFDYTHRVVNAYGKDFRQINFALGRPPWPIDRF